MSVARLGSYDVLARLASGGMAEIFAARDPNSPNRIVVLKQMLPQFADQPDFVEMFLDEGRTVSLLRHPNIVRMYDFGFHGEAPFLAMEYLHGVDLRTIMRDGRTRRRLLPLSSALSIITSVCAGLHCAHEATSLEGHPMEIVHRDISPQNIVVTFDGDVKLIDFGIAKSRSRLHETRAGALKGKVPYMSPEQIRGVPLDRRADLYAVGVLLYELVTGRRPYVIAKHEEPQGEFSMMMAIVEHRIARPSTVRAGLPDIIERVLLKALSARPAERYQTADAMKRALLEAARQLNLSLDARPLAGWLRETFGDQARKWRESLGDDQELATQIATVATLCASSSPDPLGSTAREPHGRTAIEAAELGAAPVVPDAIVAGPPITLAHACSPSLAIPPRALDDVAVVKLGARIDESFRGAERGATMSGSVVLDLSAVVRISSFGVREWLQFQSAIDAQGPGVQVYLARCPEAFVTQLGMIRAFAGRCQVVSFLAPYLCSECGRSFVHCFDCERDATLLAGPHSPTASCEACGSTANLDDDGSYFQPVRAHLGRAVPAWVRPVIDRLDAAELAIGTVDKQIDGRLTRLRFRRPLDRMFRWNRVFDGLEGNVEIDVAEARLDETVWPSLAGALRALGTEVRSVQWFGVPAELVGRVEEIARCEVRTVGAVGRCEACGVWRAIQIGRADYDALAAGRRGSAICRRCDSPLAQIRVEVPGTPVRATPPLPSDTLETDIAGALMTAIRSESVPTEPTGFARLMRARRARVATIAIAAASVAAALSYATHAPAAHVAYPPPPAPADPPAIAELAAGPVIAEGIGSGEDEHALALARMRGIRGLIAAIEAKLPPDIHRFTDPRATDAQVVTWFTARLGARIPMTRQDAIRREDGLLVTRYALAPSDLAAAVRFYSERVPAWGATFAEAPPSREPGAIVIASDRACWQVGDRLVRLGELQVTGLDVVRAAASAGSGISVHLEREGAHASFEVGGE